jgi:hypothetical protein
MIFVRSNFMRSYEIHLISLRIWFTGGYRVKLSFRTMFMFSSEIIWYFSGRSVLRIMKYMWCFSGHSSRGVIIYLHPIAVRKWFRHTFKYAYLSWHSSRVVLKQFHTYQDILWAELWNISRLSELGWHVCLKRTSLSAFLTLKYEKHLILTLNSPIQTYWLLLFPKFHRRNNTLIFHKP